MSSYDDVKRWAREKNWHYSDEVLRKVAAVVDRVGRDESRSGWLTDVDRLCGGDVDLVDAVTGYVRRVG